MGAQTTSVTEPASAARIAWQSWGGRIALAGPVALYLAISALLLTRHWEKLSPDGVCYIRRAMLLARGDFYHSISGYWSPMLSWLTVPLLWLRMDSVHALHVALVASGLVFLAGFWLFLRTFLRLGHGWHLAAGLVMAAGAATLPVRQLTPDLLLAGFLFAYFAATTSEDFLRNPRRQALAGVLGGAAYLAKAYALPFVAAHLVATVVIRAVAARQRGAMRSGLTALAGLALVAGPWIGVLSWRYGRITFSTTGPLAHAIVGPLGSGGHPHPYGRVPDPYITSEEVHELSEYPVWSPLASSENLAYQLGVIRQNAAAIGYTLWGVDALHLTAFAMLLVLVLLLLRRPPASAAVERWRIVWLLITIALYCSGYLLVYYTGRYILPVVAPLCLVLALMVARSCAARWRWASLAAGVLVLASFGWTTQKKLTPLATSRTPPTHRAIARQVRALKLQGPIASTERLRGLFVSHHLNAKFVNFPSVDQTPEEVERQIMADRPGVILVWRNIKAGDDGAEPRGPAGARGGMPPKKLPKPIEQLAADLVEPILRKPQWKKVTEISASDAIRAKGKPPARKPPTTRKRGEYVEVYRWAGDGG